MPKTILTKEDILQESNLNALCEIGMKFLRVLETMGVEAVLISDAELKRSMLRIIAEERQLKDTETKRAKEKKRLARLNKKKKKK